MQDDHYEGALIEAMDDKINFLVDAMKGMQDNINKIPKIDERLEKIEYDIPSIKFATRMTSDDMKLLKIRTEKLNDIADQLKDHKKRIIKLETVPQA